MSRASKLTLMGTSLFALGTVVFVHYQQKAEQAVRDPPDLPQAMPCHPTPRLSSFSLPSLSLINSPQHDHTTTQTPQLACIPTLIPRVQAMHEGVIRDMEQQRIKRERQLDFDMQRALEAEYKKEQTVRVSDGTTNTGTSTGGGSVGGSGR